MTKRVKITLTGGCIGGAVPAALLIVFSDGWGRWYNVGFLAAMLWMIVMVHLIDWAIKREERKEAELDAELQAEIDGGRYYDDLSWLKKD